MIYCLNPDCPNPQNPDGTNFCQSCGTGLVLLLQNRYRIISYLGGGGFGRTFLAEDTHMPGLRRCVVKQLKPVANNPQIYQLVQERFQREAAILEQLGDGNECIPTLYAYFADSGLFYLVQQWIDGETLTQKVQQYGTLTESAVKDILTNLLPVLDYVHSNGIVHRDIKPDNIILRHRDGKPVLIDFGAVRETMGTKVTTGGNTISSIVIGTPGFMPPEQASGRPVYSSDLYSLGLTAIYLLTGKDPQELDTNYSTGEIIWRRYLSASPSLADVLDKAIQSHSRDRYPTARAMLEALQPSAAPIQHTAPSIGATTVSSPQTSLSQRAEPPHTLPSRPENKLNTAIASSLIAGGLISASVIIAVALNQSQPLTQTTSTPTPATPQSAPPAIATSPVPSINSPEIKQPIQHQTLPSPSISRVEIKNNSWQQVPNTFNTKFGDSAHMDVNGIKSNGNFVIFDVDDPDGDYRQVQGVCNANGYRILVLGTWKPNNSSRVSDRPSWLNPTDYQKKLLQFACNVNITKNASWQQVPNTFNAKFGGSARMDVNGIKRNRNFVIFDVNDPDGDYRQVQGVCNANGYRILISGTWKPNSILQVNDRPSWLNPTDYQKKLLQFACHYY